MFAPASIYCAPSDTPHFGEFPMSPRLQKITVDVDRCSHVHQKGQPILALRPSRLAESFGCASHKDRRHLSVRWGNILGLLWLNIQSLEWVGPKQFVIYQKVSLETREVTFGGDVRTPPQTNAVITFYVWSFGYRKIDENQ